MNGSNALSMQEKLNKILSEKQAAILRNTELKQEYSLCCQLLDICKLNKRLTEDIQRKDESLIQVQSLIEQQKEKNEKMQSSTMAMDMKQNEKENGLPLSSLQQKLNAASMENKKWERAYKLLEEKYNNLAEQMIDQNVNQNGNKERSNSVDV